MKPLLRCISVLALSTCFALLAGCTTTSVFKARVTTFQDWPENADQTAMTYTFYHLPGQDISLEQETYENLVRHPLDNAGFIEAAPDSQPRYLVYLFVWSGEKERQVSVPVYDNAPPPVLVPGYRNPYSGIWYGSHWVYPYGMGPRYMGERLVTQNYLHARLTLIIRDTHEPSEQGMPHSVYETTAITKSASRTLLQLIPLMAQAALSDFPAANGSERIVQIELEKGR
ncbi:DUF4136 domain-containing protein [Saezia sanguinis]|nr:DUF4136 domain-containing protein [Saezia sanguinis]